jgi:hypothetical protein
MENLSSDYLRMMKYADSLYRAKQLKRAALGRMCTIAKKLGPSLAYLEQARTPMRPLSGHFLRATDNSNWTAFTPSRGARPGHTYRHVRFGVSQSVPWRACDSVGLIRFGSTCLGFRRSTRTRALSS